MSSIAPPQHTRIKSRTTNSWVTPKWIIERFGPFDLDPCAASPQPWPTAKEMITEREDGLLRLWHGFVWLNPPYGKLLALWLSRLALHRNGIALTYARTDTRAFHDFVWPFASRLLFLCGRLTFHFPNGDKAPLGHNSGGPSVLIGYGDEAALRLDRAKDLGAVVTVLR